MGIGLTPVMRTRARPSMKLEPQLCLSFSTSSQARTRGSVRARYARFYLRLPVPFDDSSQDLAQRTSTKAALAAYSWSSALRPSRFSWQKLCAAQPAVREVSAHVLGLMAERGKNIQVATSRPSSSFARCVSGSGYTM